VNDSADDAAPCLLTALGAVLGPVDGAVHAMAVGARVIFGAVRHLARNDGRANLSFGQVVVGRQTGVVQKAQHVACSVLAADLFEHAPVVRVRQRAAAQVMSQVGF
jgi:hypothetical protein